MKPNVSIYEMMMDQLNAMAVFVAVADCGGFSAAARALRVPLPTVSRKVADLEARLGTALLNRTSRRVALTEQGRRYLEDCRRILETVEDAGRRAAGEFSTPRGELTLTAPIGFGRIHMLPIVADFLREHPEISVRLLLLDRVVSLIEEGVDIAVRIGDLPDSSLVAVRAGSIGFVVCGSPDYLAARGTPRTVRDLAGHDTISVTALLPQDGWLMRGKTGFEPVPIHPRLSVTTAEAGIDAAERGLGLVRVRSYQAERALADGRLVEVLGELQPRATALSLVYPGARLVPAKLRAFLDFATPRLRTQFARPAP